MKGTPLVITGKLAQLKEADGTEGWQWVIVSIYNSPTYCFAEREAAIARSERLRCKVPKFLLVDHSYWTSICTLPLALWARDTFGITTPTAPDDHVPHDEPWLLYVECHAQLPTQVLTTLPVACNVGAAFVGLTSEWNNFLDAVRTLMTLLDALFVVNWVD